MDPQSLLCPCCGTATDAFGPGPGRRPNACCRTCGSLERHRFLALLLAAIRNQVPASGTVLDVAPSTQISSLIRDIAPDRYLSIDFDPDADGRLVDLRASLTNLPLPPASVALLVCYHVLEHIPDDALAMREIARVLAPGGMAVIQVPFRDSAPTDEDPSASPEERARRFGQADHVRFYGTDFVARLEAAGLTVSEYRVGDVLPDDLRSVIAGVSWERVWIGTSAGTVPPDPAVVQQRVTSALAEAIAVEIEATTGVVTTGPVGFGATGLSGVESELAERDAELGRLAMLARFRADRAEAVAVAAGAPPRSSARRRPAWQRRLAHVLPARVRHRLRQGRRP